MRRVNPIYLLVGFNVLFFVARTWLVPETSAERFGHFLEVTLAGLGWIGYAGILGVYSVCSFFFIPLLIPINILCGAIYGPYLGTAVAMVGITLGCVASTLSVRHVFRGLQRTIDERPAARRILGQVERHGGVVVILVRLAFVVPYLVQNIVLASTSLSLSRLTLLTVLGALPGAAIYSFLGAGLVQADSVDQLALYMAVPLVLLVVIGLVLKRFDARFGDALGGRMQDLKDETP